MNESSKVVKVRGIVKWFNDEKGFGFLTCDGHPHDIFVHKQQLQKSNIDHLQEGDKITCVINSGIKGNYATAISKEQ
jgi:cold shock CspA family protein